MLEKELKEIVGIEIESDFDFDKDSLYLFYRVPNINRYKCEKMDGDINDWAEIRLNQLAKIRGLKEWPYKIGYEGFVFSPFLKCIASLPRGKTKYLLF
jgi:hypothetical protein